MVVEQKKGLWGVETYRDRMKKMVLPKHTPLVHYQQEMNPEIKVENVFLPLREPS
jgi:hypothetical protein